MMVALEAILSDGSQFRQTALFRVVGQLTPQPRHDTLGRLAEVVNRKHIRIGIARTEVEGSR